MHLQTGSNRYDFLGGDEGYKTAWASHHTDLLEMNIWERSAVSTAERLVREGSRTGAREIVTIGTRLGSRMHRRRRERSS